MPKSAASARNLKAAQGEILNAVEVHWRSISGTASVPAKVESLRPGLLLRYRQIGALSNLTHQAPSSHRWPSTTRTTAQSFSRLDELSAKPPSCRKFIPCPTTR